MLEYAQKLRSQIKTKPSSRLILEALEFAKPLEKQNFVDIDKDDEVLTQGKFGCPGCEKRSDDWEIIQSHARTHFKSECNICEKPQAFVISRLRKLKTEKIHLIL